MNISADAISTSESSTHRKGPAHGRTRSIAETRGRLDIENNQRDGLRSRKYIFVNLEKALDKI